MKAGWQNRDLRLGLMKMKERAVQNALETELWLGVMVNTDARSASGALRIESMTASFVNICFDV